ncbi:helix-turn-helix transcriptional regulator [Bradyrhizobium sp. Pear76]|uniref:helix-turn-helix transcriptional regulator n=1 Tax=Bradyrhizobium oropedii TaxID=1571201 RepID=UPI001E4497E9|nr:AraC family transcriptional regulator [Bradyrhizobium oropedii]MCC8967884.1 helix-turn-helix transcriptional regulator [Bradyrhizobium oropedii]
MNLEAVDRLRAYGNYLAELFHQREPRSHVTRTRKHDVLAVTQIRSHAPMSAPSHSVARDEAYHVCLMIESLPDLELWQDGHSVKTEPFNAGTTGLFDLRRDPRGFHRTGYNILPFYLPRAVLIDIAQQNSVRFDGELQYTFGSSYDDAIIRNLGSALLLALERDHRVNGLFLDHILHAVGSHVVERYGAPGATRAHARGGLASWQERRAKELMSASLSSDVTLKRLAEECGLTVSHFARAFRQSAQVPPHRWLQERRVERALTMLAGREASLSEIAVDCGFADQSHFARVFRRHIGISPGKWRKENAQDGR